jgi:small ligand-binding sensory domain FIST
MMTPLQLLDRPLLIQFLRAQITSLSDQQNAAMQHAVFVGMTQEETRAFDQRSAKIAELLNQLGMIT